MRLLIGVLTLVLLSACEPGAQPLRVYNNPYLDVDWSRDLRLKAQHHDHTGARSETLLAYDEAGYDVVSLMDYSGNADLPYAWRERIWPPERFLPAWALINLRNIKILLPNAEEVGIREHLTSPFLTTYIEGRAAATAAENPSADTNSRYSSLEEGLSLIRRGNGFPCIAHPWTVWYADFEGSFCVEIYTAFESAGRHFAVPWFSTRDSNDLLRNWDYALQRNQLIWGIAVNDHYGPQRRFRAPTPADIVDSGKIVVLAREPTLESYRDAFVKGAFFAIQDRGLIKDEYPRIDSITVTSESISIETSGAVAWLTDGIRIAENATLMLSAIPRGSRYVRAEVRGEDQSVVYTQPFAIRPAGDANGDYSVGSVDALLCSSIRSSGEPRQLVRVCEGSPSAH